MEMNAHFARRSQELTCLAADSHAPECVEGVRTWLAGARLDFLFIDGDHSFEGVSTDYASYASLVDEKVGLIAMHDIVPDFRTRYGTPTEADVGQVPAFWARLRSNANMAELIEDVEQDGYGIGVVRSGSEGWPQPEERRIPRASS